MLDKKAIFVNTASQVVVRLITLLFTLISIKLLTNYLGTVGVGNYNTITTYVNFFVVIADLGLFSVTVREIAKNPENQRRILGNVFTVRLISAFIAASVAVVLVFFTHYGPEIKIGVAIASGFLFFNLIASVYDMILQYRLKMQYSALAEFLSKIFTIIALYLVILKHGDFLFIISTVTLAGILIFLFKWYFSRRFASISPLYDKKIASWIFGISWPIGLVFIIDNLFFKLDTLMLFAIKGAAAVGIYSVAYKVLEVTIFVGSYFSSSLKPAISESIENDKKFVADLIGKSINVMLIIAMPISILSAVFAKEIILFLSSPEFLSGGKALVFLSLTLPLMYLDILLGEIMIANDERKTLIKIAIFILLFNFLANLYFIPRYSFMGAAFTTFLSEFVLLMINLYFTKKIIKWRADWRMIGRIILVGALLALVSLLLRSSHLYFLFGAFIALVAYALLVWLFRIINPKSIRELMVKTPVVLEE